MGPGSPGTWTPTRPPSPGEAGENKRVQPRSLPPPPNIKLYTQRTIKHNMLACTNSKPHCAYPYPFR